MALITMFPQFYQLSPFWQFFVDLLDTYLGFFQVPLSIFDFKFHGSWEFAESLFIFGDFYFIEQNGVTS